jgi:hypothetical protein
MSIEFIENIPKIVLGTSLAFATTVQLVLSPLNASANPIQNANQTIKEEKS